MEKEKFDLFGVEFWVEGCPSKTYGFRTRQECDQFIREHKHEWIRYRCGKCAAK